MGLLDIYLVAVGFLGVGGWLAYRILKFMMPECFKL